MLFKFYNKLPRMNELLMQKFSNAPRALDVDWAVTELVDGDHIALYANHATNEFKVATRHRFLDDFDKFYCAEEIVTMNKDWVMQLSIEEKAPVVVYGKATGGQYAEKSKGIKINTVCEYFEYNEFIIHDIKIDGIFVSIFKLETLASKLFLKTAPILYSGKYKYSCGYPENMLSALPFMQTEPLPVNYNNEMKGIVIRPIYDLTMQGERLIMKKLNSKYIGAILGKPPEKKHVLTDTLVEIAAYIDNEATRLAILDAVLNAVGKFTYRDIDKIAGKYVLSTLDKVNYIKYNMLSKQEKHLVHKELNRIAKDKVTVLIRRAA